MSGDWVTIVVLLLCSAGVILGTLLMVAGAIDIAARKATGQCRHDPRLSAKWDETSRTVAYREKCRKCGEWLC